MAAMGSPTTRPRKTLDDYLALPDDVRAELIDGELYVSPAPGTPHQRVVRELTRRMCDEVERLGAGEAFVGPLDVFLPNGDVVQPDVLVIADAQSDALRRDGFHGAPALAVEVVSPSHPERDRFVKMWRYAQSGVAEYWIVDPEMRSVEVFRLRTDDDDLDRFEPAGWFRMGQTIHSEVLPGLDLSVDALFPASA